MQLLQYVKTSAEVIMSIIQFSHLTFSYEGSYDNVFTDASFQMDTDWKLGFVGRNGRGKTTLLKLLMGEYEYNGTLTSSVLFEYFPYPVKDMSRETLRIIEEIIGDEFRLWALKYELSLLEVKEDVLYRPFHTLSHGERTKVLLATLFLKDQRFLLIDEPTDHLDGQARIVTANYLDSKKGFILVSHDRWLLDSCVDHILAINRGSIEVQRGNFSSWFKNRQEQDTYELEKSRRTRKEIKRLEITAREKANWSSKVESTKIGTHTADRGHVGHLAAKAMKRSKNIENRIARELEDKETLLKDIEKVDDLTVTPLIHHSNRLIQLEDVVIYYDGRPICEPVTFTLQKGERLVLNGNNGSGKSSIIKLCLNPDEIAHEGEINRAVNLTVSYVSQDTDHLHGKLADFALVNNLDEPLFKAILRKLEFTRTQFDKDMEDFSSGLKKKVLLAKSLCQRAHVYIWDEPLNFIDVLSRVQIEELIIRSKPTMLFVEHDRVFVEKIATSRVQLRPIGSTI
jgi:lincosamide and streptogramin A transport system ATP-binding/permease protein